MRGRPGTFETDIPARLDRLPFGRFHWLVVTALGVTWILDGLEVTLVGALSPAIESTTGLGLTATQVGLSGSACILGAVLGALLFGRRTGRRSGGMARLYFDRCSAAIWPAMLSNTVVRVEASWTS